MARIRCFLLEPTGQESIYLRRYTRNNAPDCCKAHPGKYSYHNARVFLFNELTNKDEDGYIQNGTYVLLPHDDSRWPTQCACGYVFQESDEWQRFTESIYHRTDTGEEMTIRDAPAGAMWYAWWHDYFCTPQNNDHALVVKTPGGEWIVDSQSSNCTMPDDRKQEHHHCWIRHGAVPDITVDKQGATCGAGAGSIQCGNYHGFLRNGYLED